MSCSHSGVSPRDLRLWLFPVPFAAKVLPKSPVWSVTYVIGMHPMLIGGGDRLLLTGLQDFPCKPGKIQGNLLNYASQ